MRDRFPEDPPSAELRSGTWTASSVVQARITRERSDCRVPLLLNAQGRWRKLSFKYARRVVLLILASLDCGDCEEVCARMTDTFLKLSSQIF